MNFFLRHKKILVHFGVAPAVTLLAVLAMMASQGPAEQPWYGFVGYFFDSPLGMALELLCVLTVVAYTAYRFIKPATPKHRGYFVATAFFIALLLDGVYQQRLSYSIAFMSSSGMTQFFAMTVMFYCFYRLIVILPDHFRHVMTWLCTGALLLNLSLSAVSVRQMLSAGYDCHSHARPNLWFVMQNKDPLAKCSAADKAWLREPVREPAAEPAPNMPPQPEPATSGQ
ncbi:MAG: hypothetical protein GC185_03325 [Alphaproteobacteria bacterium]|nr:hypothetical protein [Alphaproteobacteria bacterium]